MNGNDGDEQVMALVVRPTPKYRSKRRMQLSSIGSLVSESASGIDFILSASVGGVLSINPSYGS